MTWVGGVNPGRLPGRDACSGQEKGTGLWVGSVLRPVSQQDVGETQQVKVARLGQKTRPTGRVPVPKGKGPSRGHWQWGKGW